MVFYTGIPLPTYQVYVYKNGSKRERSARKRELVGRALWHKNKAEDGSNTEYSLEEVKRKEKKTIFAEVENNSSVNYIQA